ncbi:hypothetical protein [Streptomyces sp. AB3(2024)]|uniref:hypothetical protein n=1 Tax=Streptomyces sp. AB3(2024) TaxID=3317321 RepID=UPI0035A32D3C
MQLRERVRGEAGPSAGPYAQLLAHGGDGEQADGGAALGGVGDPLGEQRRIGGVHVAQVQPGADTGPVEEVGVAQVRGGGRRQVGECVMGAGAGGGGYAHGVRRRYDGTDPSCRRGGGSGRQQLRAVTTPVGAVTLTSWVVWPALLVVVIAWTLVWYSM